MNCPSITTPSPRQAIASAILVLLIAWGGGCGPAPSSTEGPLHSSAGEHHHPSPHGGVTVELGEHQFQLDVLHDSTAGTLSVWVMDAHAEEFVRVPFPSLVVELSVGGDSRPLTLSAQENPATGETVGHTSQFVGQADWLLGIHQFSGVVPALRIRGVDFTQVRWDYPPPR